MTRFPQFEVAISDADRAEIEAMYIELMRALNADTQREMIAPESLPPDLSRDSEPP